MDLTGEEMEIFNSVIEKVRKRVVNVKKKWNKKKNSPERTFQSKDSSVIKTLVKHVANKETIKDTSNENIKEYTLFETTYTKKEKGLEGEKIKDKRKKLFRPGSTLFNTEIQVFSLADKNQRLVL